MKVTIVDARAEWMKKEDRIMTCFWRCKLYKYCATKAGFDCKWLGGDVIPKITKK